MPDILSSNFFELFDIPVSSDIDMELVQQRYRELQKAVHPDKFASSSDQEKRISMQHTSWINEAFNTLKQPVNRAIYLLKLKGVDINLENETTMDAGFLMEQMEMREAMAGIRDKADPIAEVDEIAKKINERIKTEMSAFSLSFNGEQLEQARESIRKMQFLQKAKKEVDELSAELEDELY